MTLGKVVLFNHPGGEHQTKRVESLFEWNTDDHRRKYLAVNGQVAVSNGGQLACAPVTQKLALWGEFEPPTRAHAFRQKRRPGLPQSWHELLPIGVPPNGAQNTDPWVFGDSFRYGLCRQSSIEYLRHLCTDDLLLFGSYLLQDADGRPATEFNFFLDTVFVVRRRFPLDDLKAIPPALMDPTYRRGAYNRFNVEERRTCVFYEAAMLGTSPQGDLFSFSPCAVWNSGDEPPRFRRPMIGHLFDKSFGNGQVFTQVEGVSPQAAWSRVVEHCVKAGFNLAVRIDEPGLERGTTDEGVGAATCGTRAKGTC